MFKIITKAVRDFFHFLNPDRCRFYARQLDRIAEIARHEAPRAIHQCKNEDERVMALADLMDRVEKLAREDYRE